MPDISNEMLDNYSQKRYDFEPNALTRQDIMDIKKLAREKRSDYNIAPIGTGIFNYICERENNLYFEKECFDNKDLDALIYFPDANRDIAYIVINSNQPLMNQIFAAAHEYYHFLKDFEEIRRKPQVCSLSSLKNINEQKASRFAAEFLLPGEALNRFVEKYLVLMKRKELRELEDVAAVCYYLSITFGMPLKAVLFRLCEEGYLKDIGSYITNYDFIKRSFQEIKWSNSKQAEELLNNDNPFIEEIMYRLIPGAYERGYVSLDVMKRDIEILGLDSNVFSDILDRQEAEEDEDEIADDLILNLSAKLNSRKV